MNSYKSLVIFIHGIGSNKNTWKNFINILKSDHDLRFSDKELSKFNDETNHHYTFFEYNSPINNTIFDTFNITNFFRKKNYGELNAGDLTIDSHSETLKSEIETIEKDYTNINIVAHSMGGLIVLNFIFKVLNYPILNKISKIILYASPLAGSDDSKDIKNFFDNRITENFFTYAVKELEPQSNTILNLQQGIIKYKNQLKNLDILFIYGTQDSRILIESKSIAESFSKDVKSVQANHSEIIKPLNINDKKYIWFKDFILSQNNFCNIEEIIKNAMIKTNTHNDLFSIIIKLFSETRNIRRDMHTKIQNSSNEIKQQILNCMKELIDSNKDRIQGEAYYCLGEITIKNKRFVDEIFLINGFRKSNTFAKACCANVLIHQVPLKKNTVKILQQELLVVKSKNQLDESSIKLIYYIEKTLTHNKAIAHV